MVDYMYVEGRGTRGTLGKGGVEGQRNEKKGENGTVQYKENEHVRCLTFLAIWIPVFAT
jgi:hypothetical protein